MRRSIFAFLAALMVFALAAGTVLGAVNVKSYPTASFSGASVTVTAKSATELMVLTVVRLRAQPPAMLP